MGKEYLATLKITVSDLSDADREEEIQAAFDSGFYDTREEAEDEVPRVEQLDDRLIHAALAGFFERTTEEDFQREFWAGCGEFMNVSELNLLHLSPISKDGNPPTGGTSPDRSPISGTSPDGLSTGYASPDAKPLLDTQTLAMLHKIGSAISAEDRANILKLAGIGPQQQVAIYELMTGLRPSSVDQTTSEKAISSELNLKKEELTRLQEENMAAAVFSKYPENRITNRVSGRKQVSLSAFDGDGVYWNTRFSGSNPAHSEGGTVTGRFPSKSAADEAHIKNENLAVDYSGVERRIVNSMVQAGASEAAIEQILSAGTLTGTELTPIDARKTVADEIRDAVADGALTLAICEDFSENALRASFDWRGTRHNVWASMFDIKRNPRALAVALDAYLDKLDAEERKITESLVEGLDDVTVEKDDVEKDDVAEQALDQMVEVFEKLDIPISKDPTTGAVIIDLESIRPGEMPYLRGF